MIIFGNFWLSLKYLLAKKFIQCLSTCHGDCYCWIGLRRGYRTKDLDQYKALKDRQTCQYRQLDMGNFVLLIFHCVWCKLGHHSSLLENRRWTDFDNKKSFSECSRRSHHDSTSQSTLAYKIGLLPRSFFLKSVEWVLQALTSVWDSNKKEFHRCPTRKAADRDLTDAAIVELRPVIFYFTGSFNLIIRCCKALVWKL